MLEGRESVVMKSSGRGVPLPSDMPTMLMFRRIAYRLYPNKQVVALYYSKLVNKYLSIPFGPNGNLNLSEAVVHDTLEEGILKTIGKTAVGALEGGFHGGLRGAAWGRIAGVPGLTLGGVVGGVVGGIKGGKRAYDKAKEDEKMQEDWSDAKYKSPSGGLTQAGVDAYNRQTGGHLKTAVTTKPSKLKKGSKAANRRKSFCARMGGMKKRLTSAKTARDPDSRINKALRKWNCEESFRQKLAEKRQERIDEIAPLVGAALRAAGGYALDKVIDWATTPDKKNKKDKNKEPIFKPHDATRLVHDKPTHKAISSFTYKRPTDDTFNSKYKSTLSKELDKPSQQRQQIAENKISDIQNMLNEGNDTMDLSINGRTVTLNNSMAKKIIRVYESVNTKNKKIVESMLNEDLDSFKKLLNFSIKA